MSAELTLLYFRPHVDILVRQLTSPRRHDLNLLPYCPARACDAP